MAGKKRGLSKGLDALLADTLDLKTSEGNSTKPSVHLSAGFVEINVKQMQPGRFQPRKTIHEPELEALSNSIKEQGVLQPIVVRSLGEGKGYEIIAGERRWRAAQKAGLATVPVIIRDVNDEAALAIALIENIQRENLNPLEEAIAFSRLGEEFGLSHAEIANAVGKSRTTITNLLRILNLEPDVQAMLDKGHIELGHAKVLLALQGAQQTMVARAVVAKKLSVRETEHLVERTLSAAAGQKVRKLAQDPDIRRLERRLADTLGSSVQILQSTKEKGKLQIKYNSLDELDGILARIIRE